MKESNCCGAKLYHPDIAMCTDCGEHCDVVDNKETWQNRFDKTIIVSEQMNKDIKEFFQQELNGMCEEIEKMRGEYHEDSDFECVYKDSIIELIKGI